MTRILVVDDELEVREVVKTALQRNGYQVMEAANGIEAYAAAADAAVAEKPDLIVLDLMLPKLNGFEVLEKLKQNPQTSYIPVVILTARGQSQDETRALRSRATDYMTKPWSADELSDRVRLALDQRRTAKPHTFKSAERVTDSRRNWTQAS